MRLYVTVKQAGRRKDVLGRSEVVLRRKPLTLRDLITDIVEQNVYCYNQELAEPLLVKHLLESEIEEGAAAGKVGFGVLAERSAADPVKAVQAALLAFDDGIFRCFINREEVISLGSLVRICDGDVLTFVRLTMLAGRTWW